MRALENTDASCVTPLADSIISDQRLAKRCRNKFIAKLIRHLQCPVFGPRSARRDPDARVETNTVRPDNRVPVHRLVSSPGRCNSTRSCSHRAPTTMYRGHVHTSTRRAWGSIDVNGADAIVVGGGPAGRRAQAAHGSCAKRASTSWCWTAWRSRAPSCVPAG